MHYVLSLYQKHEHLKTNTIHSYSIFTVSFNMLKDIIIDTDIQGFHKFSFILRQLAYDAILLGEDPDRLFTLSIGNIVILREKFPIILEGIFPLMRKNVVYSICFSDFINLKSPTDLNICQSINQIFERTVNVYPETIQFNYVQTCKIVENFKYIKELDKCMQFNGLLINKIKEVGLFHPHVANTKFNCSLNYYSIVFFLLNSPHEIVINFKIFDIMDLTFIENEIKLRYLKIDHNQKETMFMDIKEFNVLNEDFIRDRLNEFLLVNTSNLQESYQLLEMMSI